MKTAVCSPTRRWPGRVCGPLLAIGAVWCAVSPLPTTIISGSLPTRLPLKIDRGVPTMEVQIGAGKPVRAVLDTALAMSVVRPEEAAAHDLSPGTEATLLTPLGPVAVRRVRDVSLRLGGVSLSGVPMAVGEYPRRTQGQVPPAVPPMWLGVSATGECTLLLDPDAPALTLLSPESEVPRAARATSVLLADGRVQALCRVNGAAAQPWLISTGTPATLVPAGLIKSMGLAVENERDVAGLTGERVHVGIVNLKEIAVGPVKIPQVRAVTVLSGMEPTMPTLGTDVLLRYRLYLNVSRRIMGLMPRTGGQLQQPGAPQQGSGRKVEHPQVPSRK